MHLHLNRRRFVVLASGFAAGCAQEKKSTAPIRTYELRGEVRRLERERQTAIIRHEKIDGWMEAMTMEFPVRDKAEFGKLTEGSRIRATVNVQDLDYWLTNIQSE